MRSDSRPCATRATLRTAWRDVRAMNDAISANSGAFDDTPSNWRPYGDYPRRLTPIRELRVALERCVSRTCLQRRLLQEVRNHQKQSIVCNPQKGCDTHSALAIE